MKKNTIFTLLFCCFGTFIFAQTPKQKFQDKFHHLIESNINASRTSNSIFLLEKVEVFEGKDNVLEPKTFPSNIKKFTYFTDNRLKSDTEDNEFGLFERDYTYLNAKDNLYSSIKKTQTGSFGSSIIDSFFYDDKNREIRHLTRNLTDGKKLIGLDSTFYEGNNKNFSTKKDFLTLDFGGLVATILKKLTANELQNDNISKTETSYWSFEGKKTFDVKTEYILDPINNVLSTIEFSRDTAANSPWVPLSQNNKKLTNDGSIIYEANYEYEPNASMFYIVDSLYNNYANNQLFDFADFFVINNFTGKLILLAKIEATYDKNQNIDSLKFLSSESKDIFKLYSYEKYYWKEIKNVSSKDVIQPKLDFDIIENNNASLVINIQHLNANSCFVQVNSLDGRLLSQTKTDYDNAIRLDVAQSGLYLVSVFDEKGNVKTKKVWFR